MNTMNNYDYNEGIEFNGLMPKVMEADGIETIGASDFNAKLFENGHLGCDPLEVVDFQTVMGGGVNPEPEQHKYVDLGLPSGTLWATCNIGANSPEEAGLYFAWGETQGYTAEQVGFGEGKRRFTWNDYKFGPETAITKYNNTDRLTVLEPEDDAATVNWGSNWRMPTKEQFEELMTLPHKWDSSRSGYSFTDGNDNELLFVFAGGYAGSGKFYNLGEYGYCWLGSLYEDNDIFALELLFNSVRYNIGYYKRYAGHTVRPVRSQNL